MLPYRELVVTTITNQGVSPHSGWGDLATPWGKTGGWPVLPVRKAALKSRGFPALTLLIKHLGKVLEVAPKGFPLNASTVSS